MRILLVIGAIVGLALLPACGARDDNAETVTLHMGRYDISESDFQAFIRSELLKPGAKEFCQGIQGLSAKDVGETIAALGTPEPGWTPPPGGIVVARETSVPGDRKKAAKIVQEECARILRP